MIKYLITFILGWLIAGLFNAKRHFDLRCKEMYFEYRGKRYYVTRARVGFGCEVFIDEEKQETHKGYVFGLPNASLKPCSVRLQSMMGDKNLFVNEKESFQDKINQN